jgi:hypothetical protein
MTWPYCPAAGEQGCGGEAGYGRHSGEHTSVGALRAGTGREDRARAHLLICMPARYLSWRLRKA